jgi:hypothetical protein
MLNRHMPLVQPIRSQPITWAAGANTAFLASAMLSQITLGDDAVIVGGGIEWQFNASTGVAGGDPRALPQLCARLNMMDNIGMFCDATGQALETLNQWEMGIRSDPTTGAPANAANADYYYFQPFHWLFPNLRVARPADCFIPRTRWMDTLQASVTFGGATIGPANGWTINSGTARLVFFAIPNPLAKRGLLEDGTRLFVKEETLTAGQTQQSLDVGGRLRWGNLFQGVANWNAGTRWNGVTTVLTVQELRLAAIPAVELAYRERWNMPSTRVFDFTAANQTITDMVDFQPPQSPYALTLFANAPGSEIKDSPFLVNINPQLTGATFPAGSTWLRTQWNKVGNCDRDGAVIDPRSSLPNKLSTVPADLRDYVPVARPFKVRGC